MATYKEEALQKTNAWLAKMPHLTAALKAAGVDVPLTVRIQNLRRTGAEPAYVAGIVQDLPGLAEREDQGIAIRLLTMTKAAYDASYLVRLYLGSSDKSFKFDILTTLTNSNAQGAKDFLLAVLRDKSAENEVFRMMLISCISNAYDGRYLLQEIMPMGLDKVPFAMLYSIQKHGRPEDLEYLRRYDPATIEVYPGHERTFVKEYDKTVRKLTRMAERQKAKSRQTQL